MRDTLEYIDAYFNHELEENEQKEFAFRCTADKQFAEDVAFYVAARAEARQLLLQQKQQWVPDDVKIAAAKPPVKKLFKSWMPYASAACVIAIIALVSVFQTPSSTQMAAQYINHYDTLSHTLGASADSLQLGISAYNDNNFKHAAQLFDGVATIDSTNWEALKYSGLAYLQMNEYSKALQRFGQLSSITNLQINGGDMLQAVTLLKRNEAGDKAKAKILLQKVINENEEGGPKAKAILDRW